MVVVTPIRTPAAVLVLLVKNSCSNRATAVVVIPVVAILAMVMAMIAVVVAVLLVQEF